MTNPNKTLIAMLVDRSGSMIRMKADMDQAIKAFFDTQREVPGEAVVSLSQFDNRYEDVFSFVDLKRLPSYEILPRNSTALYDAMGKMITEIGEKLAETDEDERPSKVIFVVVTDGYENASTEWTQQMVNDLVTQQKDQWSWEFVFLGAGIDAVQVGAGLGISRGSTLTFDAASAPVAMAAMGNYVTTTRSGVAASFSEEDRKDAVK